MADKKVLQLFVPHAVVDRVDVDFLLKALETQFANSKRFEIDFWQCRKDILVGEKWHDSIQAGLATSDLGLLMVSPAFLARDYIGKHELPKFVGPEATKPLIPVGLKPVDFQRQDLKGLKDFQIFRREGKFFTELSSRMQKEDFAYRLYQSMEDRLAAVSANV